MGTLFLDEIGELSLPIQVKLLRVLQEEEFYRLGSTKNVKMDVRIIAATNKNLFDEIKRGNFRKDLFFRLNINAIHLPALRERPGDIPLLAEHFFAGFCERYNKEIQRISEPVMNLLKNYSFPGNVRELMNIINSAIVVESGNELRRASLPSYFLENSRNMPEPTLHGDPMKSLQEVERDHIRKVLEHTGNNKDTGRKDPGNLAGQFDFKGEEIRTGRLIPPGQPVSRYSPACPIPGKPGPCQTRFRLLPP